jgi:outer membrane protein
MLTDELKKKRTDQIFYHEKECGICKVRFGFQGDLFKLRVELLKPWKIA